jgi:hypothetical protein
VLTGRYVNWTKEKDAYLNTMNYALGEVVREVSADAICNLPRIYQTRKHGEGGCSDGGSYNDALISLSFFNSSLYLVMSLRVMDVTTTDHGITYDFKKLARGVQSGSGYECFEKLLEARGGRDLRS